MPTRIISDTDIGTCIDDVLALAVVLGSPELRLAGVACVYGDVDLRARMVGKLLVLHGTRGVPVLRGARAAARPATDLLGGTRGRGPARTG